MSIDPVEWTIGLTNPRARPFGLRKRELLASYHELANKELQGALNPAEWKTLQLFRAISTLGCRMEEFGRFDSADALGPFLRQKAALLAQVAAQPLPADDLSVDELIAACISLRACIDSSYERCYRIRGRDATFRDSYVDCGIAEAALAALEVQPSWRSEGAGWIQLVNADSLAKAVETAIRQHISGAEAIVITLPLEWKASSLDARSFKVFATGDNGSPLSFLVRRVLAARMALHKNRERLEVGVSGYKKRYSNLTEYDATGSEVRGHQFVGIRYALRYVVDVRLSNGTIWGLADLRVARIRSATAFQPADLAVARRVGQLLGLSLERTISENEAL